jgi:dolichyl-phosphate beta-glucosyltransferase
MLAYFAEQNASVEILVVSDGSTDNTNALVSELAAKHPCLHLLSYSPNHGKGFAVRHGMMQAQGERVLFSDADLATPIEEIEKLTAALNSGSDIAIGSRDVKGSQLERRQSMLRELGGRTFNKLVQIAAVPGIRDTQCGFKLFTRRAAQDIFSRCQVDHFAFDVEALYIARRLFGYKISEIPVRWAHQEGSKVRFFRDAFRMLKTLFKIRATRYAPPAAVEARLQ